MLAQQRRQDILTNNMANALTPGYKTDQTSLRSFPELLIQQMGEKQIPVKNGLRIPTNQPIGSINTGVYMHETTPMFEQGDVRDTGIQTDVALVNGQLPDDDGFLFFTVQNEDGGMSYTRNGNFTVDAEGFLTSSTGYYVLDATGNRIQTGSNDFQVNANGQILVNGNTIPLGIAYHPNATADMVKVGNDLFEVEGDAQPVDARGVAGVTFEVQQGVLEGSNVDTIQTMTDMMAAYRSFELNQQVLKAYDQSMDLAANQIGKLR